MVTLPHRDGPADRWPHARPGFILSAMAGICAVLVLIPPVGTLIVLHQNGALTIGNVLKLGWLVLTAIVAVLSPPRPLMVVLAIPSVLIFVFSIVFLTAFAFRAAWGPRILGVLAILWALSVNASTIVMPLLTFSGSLPVMTFLGMIPALIAPLVFSIGFAGFMVHGDVARAWFRTGPREARA
jgi:hypothetical protein